MSPVSVLAGSDFSTLGEVGVTALDDGCAAAISRGRFPKGYPYVDPNEDAAVIAASGSATLLAVADGHNGFEAAGAAIETIVERAEMLLSDPSDAGLDLLASSVSSAIGRVVHHLDPPRSESRTALSVAVIHSGVVRTFTAGDTVVAMIRDGSTRVFPASAPFLGADLGTSPQVGELALEPDDLVVVASDGLIDFLGRHWPDRLAVLPAYTCETFVRAAVDAAFAGGAGDNVTVAALRIP